MVNRTTLARIESLAARYRELANGRGHILHDIAVAEIPEMVYNSNAIPAFRVREKWMIDADYELSADQKDSPLA